MLISEYEGNLVGFGADEELENKGIFFGEGKAAGC